MSWCEKRESKARATRGSEEGTNSAHQDDDDDTGACHSLKAAAGIIRSSLDASIALWSVFRCPRRECVRVPVTGRLSVPILFRGTS